MINLKAVEDAVDWGVLVKAGADDRSGNGGSNSSTVLLTVERLALSGDITASAAAWFRSPSRTDHR